MRGARPVASLLRVADKPKTPPPPRRVQAPKVRGDRRGRIPRDRRALVLVGAAVVALAAVAAAAAFVFASGDGDTETAANGTVSGSCTEKSYRALEGTHVNDFNAKPKWNSSPPTSGPHHSQTVIWGFYDEPVNQVQTPHNLEHGGIVIQYGDEVSQEDVGALRDFWQDDPNGILVAPLPRLGNKIALASWERAGENEQGHGTGHLAICTGFDKDAVSDFVDKYRFKGPEDAPPDALEPGE